MTLLRASFYGAIATLWSTSAIGTGFVLAELGWVPGAAALPGVFLALIWITSLALSLSPWPAPMSAGAKRSTRSSTSSAGGTQHIGRAYARGFQRDIDAAARTRPVPRGARPGRTDVAASRRRPDLDRPRDDGRVGGRQPRVPGRAAAPRGPVHPGRVRAAAAAVHGRGREPQADLDARDFLGRSRSTSPIGPRGPRPGLCFAMYTHRDDNDDFNPDQLSSRESFATANPRSILSTGQPIPFGEGMPGGNARDDQDWLRWVQALWRLMGQRHFRRGEARSSREPYGTVRTARERDPYITVIRLRRPKSRAAPKTMSRRA